jgi:hypothetical protein
MEDMPAFAISHSWDDGTRLCSKGFPFVYRLVSILFKGCKEGGRLGVKGLPGMADRGCVNARAGVLGHTENKASWYI